LDCKEIQKYNEKLSFTENLLSPSYLLLLIWLTFNSMVAYFYIGSVNSQLAALANEDESDEIDRLVIAYSIILPAGGLVMILLGLFLDKIGFIRL